MKIAFDARLFGIRHRGIGMYTENLLITLKEKDQTNNYYILGGENANYLASANWQLIKADCRVYSCREQILIPKLINKLKPDLVHYPHFNVPLCSQRPFIVTVHDLILHQFPNERASTLPKWLYCFKLAIYHLVVKRALTKALAIITVSQSVKEDIIKYYPQVASKIKVIYEAPALLPKDIPKDRKERLIKEDYWLYVGAAYPHKNLSLLLRAFTKAKKGNRQLVLVGRQDYFYQQLKLLAKKEKLTKGVIFWGEVSQVSLANLYANAAGYLSPSLAEGFDLSALQAAFFHKPILASNIKVHQEILKEAAIFFEPQNLEDLTCKLEQFYQSPPKFNYQKLEQDLAASFNWQKTAQETLCLYQNLKLL